MKKLGKIIITLLILFALVPAGRAFAAGGYANEGTSPAGGNCNAGSTGYWWDTCFGFSWQKYKVVKDLPTSGNKVHFHYTKETGGVIGLKVCKKDQILYNYGFEVFKNGASTGYQVSTQKWNYASGAQAKWHYDTKQKKYVALGAYPGANNTTKGYLVVSGYASWDKAWSAFHKMETDDWGKQFIPAGVNWDNAGYFCYSPGYTLIVHYVNKDTKKEITGTAKIEHLDENKYAIVGKKDISGYRFLGWATKADGGIITNTTKNKDNKHGVYVGTADGSNKYNSGSNTIYKNVGVYMNNSKHIYAMYTQILTLTKKTDAGVKKLTVARTASPYSTVSNDLSSNSQIFTGDSLKICLELNNNYTLKDFYVDGGGKKESLVSNRGKYCGTVRYKVSGSTTVAAYTSPPPPITLGGKCDTIGATFTGDETGVASKARAEQGDWGELAYAAPSQQVEWVHCYYSGKTGKTGDSSFKVKQSPIFPSSVFNEGTNISSFDGYREYTSETFNKNEVVTKEFPDSYNVETGSFSSSKVGQTLTEEISSSYGGSNKSASAKVLVPYNFDIKTKKVKEAAAEGDEGSDEVTIDAEEETGTEEEGSNTGEEGSTEGEESSVEEKKCTEEEDRNGNCVKPVVVEFSNDDVVFAGEKAKIKEVTVDVGKRYNSKTGLEYATRVDNAYIKLYSYLMNEKGVRIGDVQFTGTEYPSNGEKGYFNKEENMDGGIESHLQGSTVDVPDVSAGHYFCVVAKYGPVESVGDTDMYSNNSEVGETDPVCRKIAKKPNMQIWGGNIYSTSKIETSVAAKSSLAGYDAGKTYVFGSWGELGVVSTGVVSGLASGAGTGYDGIDGSGRLIANPGGSLGNNGDFDFCKISTLSFANIKCDGTSSSGKVTGGLGGNTSVGVDSNKLSIINSFKEVIEGDDTATSEEVNEGEMEIDINSDSSRDIKSRQNLTIKSANISEGVYIAQSQKDVRISGNLIYSGSYNAIGSVPKLVIYAENNIYIDCGVENIDALLVAEGAVVTCSDNIDKNGESSLIDEAKRTIDKRENSKQLKVNGAIIANKIIANRTYGAQIGDGSIEPAEIINFDPTLYLWGIEKTEVTNSGEKMTITNIKELAPRY